ncbi:hypothetical protein [Hydrogenophaga sp. 5NK40-0174]|uniref:hypothetical protein n=1 Tax=Hydrogenophaga sp. 5NK40-0174 TaxID=3127649 RepID=UPI00310A176A
MNKTIRVSLMLGAMLALAGCASKNTSYVNKATGETRYCTASGIGFVGAPMALHMHDVCAQNMQAAGFEAVGPSKLTISTDEPEAEIYAGPNEYSLNTRIGTSPFELVHPQNGRLWTYECYQARKAGKNTKPVCVPPTEGDRSVSLTFAD